MRDPEGRPEVAPDWLDADDVLEPRRSGRGVGTGVRSLMGRTVTALIALVFVVALISALRSRGERSAGTGPNESAVVATVTDAVSNLGVNTLLPGTSDCPTPRPGFEIPATTIGVLRRHLEIVGSAGSAYAIDQLDHLCQLTTRSRTRGGLVLVTSVSGPSFAGAGTKDAQTYAHLRTAGGKGVSVVGLTVAGGWRLVIGAVGPFGVLPAKSELEAIAGDPALRW